MSVDEPVRLRLHRRLAELLNAELADAMMESMPPTRWDQLATKDDLERLEHLISAQGERLENLIATQGKRFENRIDALGDRVDAQIHNFSGEMALLEGRLSVRYAETTRMIVFAMMTLFVGGVAVIAATLA